MNAVRILALCVTAALICASIRSLHPQMASAVALAAGGAAIMLSIGDISIFAETIKSLDKLASQNGESLALLKICGVAMVAEFASDICREAGETMLAKRIDTGVRIGIVASAIPTVGNLLSSVVKIIE